jgi:hypothetical protein
MGGRADMNGIRKDVRDLIAVNERLQSALAQGEQLTDDEAGLIRMCANELLAKTASRLESRFGNQDGHAGTERKVYPHQSSDS